MYDFDSDGISDGNNTDDGNNRANDHDEDDMLQEEDDDDNGDCDTLDDLDDDIDKSGDRQHVGYCARTKHPNGECKILSDVVLFDSVKNRAVFAGGSGVKTPPSQNSQPPNQTSHNELGGVVAY